MRIIQRKFIASKDNLLRDIENSCKNEFPNLFPISLERIEDLLNEISDNVSFLLEFPYIDEHFRDCYYSYHAEKFQTISRDTIRVHIFSDKVKDENCIFTDEFINDKYYGFFIIRPLKKFPLGRKFISPKILKQNNFLCCLTEEKVYLLGRKFLVQGVSHISQDTETHTCAESSLWVLTDYYGSKYKRYQKLLPSEIIDKLNESARRRMLPSSGLSISELSLVLMKYGHNCILYTDSKKSNILSILRIYIESGIPLIISVQNKNAGHAMVAIGHEDIKKTVFPKDKIWIDISEINKKICVMDDNRPPYAIIDAKNPTKGYEKELSDMKITSLIVPLHKHMFYGC